MQDKILKCLGLCVQYNPLTVAPGALSRANDCMIRRENIIENRRGHASYATLSNNIAQLLVYQNRVLAHNGTVLSYDNGSGTFADYSGSYTAVTSNKIRSVEAFTNLYFTTNSGVQVLTDISGTAARKAGAPRSLDPSYTLTGASGFLANNYQCAYRCVIRRTDANLNVLTGYPSQRLWVTNAAGGSRNVILTLYLPSEAIANDIIQFYRTEQVSGTSDDTSADEMGLIYQYSLTSSDVSTGYITFTDSITDSLRGATLYTSPSQEGIAQANERPPLCKDMTLYKSNYMLYANTQTKQRLYVTLVGTSGLSGKTITLGGVTYNFGGSEITSGGGSPQANVSATGVAATDIDLTARSLVRVINRYASNTTVYAYYLSGPSDLPGQIMIEEKGVGASAFTIQSSDTTIQSMFYPAPPVSPSTNTNSTSTNSIEKNMVYYSKSQQPEHVPLLNKLPVGPANKEILRIVALRDSAIVIKEEGVYRITGETPQSFSVVPVDLTVFCKAMNSVVVLSNQVFMLSNQGVVVISESGVQVISREIENLINPLLINTSLASYTYGCAYESERSYFLTTITDPTDTAANQTLVYNVFTRTWVRHTYAMSAGIIEPSADKMYFSKPDGAVIYRERKAFSDDDYVDPEYTITILTVSGTTVTFSISGGVPEAGWVITQGTTSILIDSIIAISTGYQATLAEDPPGSWAAGAATASPSIEMDIEWQSWTFNNPDALKQVRAVGFLTDDTAGANSVTSLLGTFRSNFDPEREEVEVEEPSSGWGSAWGSSPWGGAGDSNGYPTYVPQNKQYCTRLTVGVKHKNAKQKISLTGLCLSFEMASDRIGR